MVVFIESAPSGKQANPQPLRSTRHGVSKGRKTRVKSNDPKLHIPHGYLGEKTVFNLSLPFKNPTIDATSKIRQAGIMKVVCDTYGWMVGYVHVFDHPSFAVTNEQGAFSIPNLPPGNYVLRVWHENAGINSQEITAIARAVVLDPS